MMTRLTVLGAAAWLLSTTSTLGEVVVDWSFNQSSGTAAIDSGPNQIDGALAGNANWAAGSGQTPSMSPAMDS